MGVADNHIREIERLSYGKDLRKPIHDALKILMESDKSPRPVVVLTKNEYQAIENPDPNTFYAVIFEGGDNA